MNAKCPKCGGDMVVGIAATTAAIKLHFVIPGKPASLNPLKSFAQGLADEPSDKVLPIQGKRCSKCGFLELYAND